MMPEVFHNVVMLEAKFPPSVAGLLEATIPFLEAAISSARAGIQAAGRPDETSRRGATLRPGVDTPVWNELVNQIAPLLRKRGEKAKLARILGLPRQRIHEFFVSRTACPDAERALLLFIWLAMRQQGKSLG